MLRISTIVGGLALLTGCNASRQLQTAHEISAIQQIKTIGAAEIQYYSQSGRYAATLAELGNGGLISKDLAGGKAGGYVFTLQSTPEGFSVTAVPETTESGTRSFYSDQTMVVRNETNGGRAGASSPEVK